MWGRNPSARLTLAVVVALSAAAGCGGRSARHGASGAAGSGGAGGSAATGGASGASGGSAGSIIVAGGSGGKGGSGGLLRPCSSAPVPPELLPVTVVLIDASDGAQTYLGGQAQFDLVRVMLRPYPVTTRDGVRLGMAIAREGLSEGCSAGSRYVAPAPLDSPRRRSLGSLLDDDVSGGPSTILATYASILDLLEPSEDHPDRAAVVVIGSGLPGRDVSCEPADVGSYALELASAADAARAHGISTFAIGFTGSAEERHVLMSLAVAGGTAPETCNQQDPSSCFHDVPTSGDVRYALSNVLEDVLVRSHAVCTFSLDDIPSERVLDPEYVNFALRTEDDTTILERTDPGPCVDGWFFGPDERSITLCSESCATFRGDSRVTLDIAVACDGPPPRN